MNTRLHSKQQPSIRSAAAFVINLQVCQGRSNDFIQHTEYCILFHMSETLYRKYRPKSFKEVIGQEEIVSSLENALKSEKIGHAYIFAGSRGTGKTTIARIFAAELGSSVNDVYEIDAASNNGVDEVRALNEAVNTLPFDSKYKIYILDEAHMLSKSAWNALLKTLEEPPAHVIFILATTEIEKIPDTILSRCETYTFKKPSDKTLEEVIKRTAKKEGFEVEAEAAEVLSLIADGSFRDAHGALQKIIFGSGGQKIELKDVERISGVPKIGVVHDLITAISERNSLKIVEIVRELREDGRDVKAFMKLLLDKVRAILLIRLGAGDGVQSIVSPEHFAFLKSESVKPFINSEVLLSLLDAYERVSHSSFPDIALEASLLSLLSQ